MQSFEVPLGYMEHPQLLFLRAKEICRSYVMSAGPLWLEVKISVHKGLLGYLMSGRSKQQVEEQM